MCAFGAAAFDATYVIRSIVTICKQAGVSTIVEILILLGSTAGEIVVVHGLHTGKLKTHIPR